MAYITYYRPYFLANRDENHDSAMERFSRRFNGNRNNTPATNVYETDNEYQIEMALPGVEKKDIHVKHEKGYLYVTVDSKENNDEKKYDRYEFNYSGASRVFKTGELINPDRIEGKLENGILTLTLPKKEEYIKKPAQLIEIQ